MENARIELASIQGHMWLYRMSKPIVPLAVGRKVNEPALVNRATGTHPLHNSTANGTFV